MKLLVGLACVAIVAFVGYFFWGEWQSSEQGRLAEVAFMHNCHRDVGELFESMQTAKAFTDNPELRERIEACASRLGEGWAKTEDAVLLALQTEGAARIQ